MNSTYKPNTTDPRTKARVTKVLAWCRLYLSPDSPEQVHHKTLKDVFGMAMNPLSKCLRDRLLIQSGFYRPLRFCKPGEQPCSYSYTLDQAQFELLKQEFNPSNMVITSAICLSDDTRRELAERTFTYDVIDHRSYHPLQNIRSTEKAAFWHEFGFDHHYDIEAAGPTLLSQLAVWRGWSKNRLTEINDFIQNRRSFRLHVSQITGCSPKTGKEIVAALFNGAILNFGGAIFLKHLNQDKDKLQALKDDHQVIQLQLAARRLWKKLGVLLDRDLSDGKSKAALYRELESYVIQVSKNYLTERGIHYFLEHDGFITDALVDLNELQLQIKQQTNFDVTFSKI